MNITVVSKKYGTQSINTDSFNPRFASSNSTIYKVVEHIFNEWYSYRTQPGAPMSKDIRGMYFGEADQPAIYNVKGAIIQGIENFIEEVTENGKGKARITTSDILKMDIEAAFE